MLPSVLRSYMSTETDGSLTGPAHIGADVDPDFKQEIRVEAAKQGIPMSQFIRQALADKLENDQ